LSDNLVFAHSKNKHRYIFSNPPEGFEPAATFQGFQPYDKVTQGFTIQGLKLKGVIPRKKEDFIIVGTAQSDFEKNLELF